jgi:hypothetical protein
VQKGLVKRSLVIDNEMAVQVDRASSLVQKKSATVLRVAIQAGFPSVTNRLQAPRPLGYFAGAYKNTRRPKLENTVGKALIQKPER